MINFIAVPFKKKAVYFIPIPVLEKSILTKKLVRLSLFDQILQISSIPDRKKVAFIALLLAILPQQYG